MDFFKDKDDNVVIAQMPNIPIIMWVLFTVLNRFFDIQILGYLGSAALTGWALWEIFDGDSPFRRTLGAVVLLLTLVTFLL